MTIELHPGERRRYTFMGWHENGVGFYALDETATPSFVQLTPAYPHNFETGRPFRFEIVEPRSIFPTRLVPPACVSAMNEGSSQNGAEADLFPMPKHKAALQTALENYQADAARSCASEVHILQNASVLELFLFDSFRTAAGAPVPFRSPESIEAERQRQLKQIEDKYRPMLEMPLEELIYGESVDAQKLRNQVLIEAWAKETQADLKMMEQARHRFYSQWRKACGDGLPEENSDEREATVRFGLKVATNETFYLSGVIVRSLLTPREVDDFLKLKAVYQQSPRDQPDWHSPDFRTVRRYTPRGTLEEHHLTNEFRAVCLLLDQRPGKSAQYAEIEPAIGSHTRELDIADGHGSKSSPSGGRRLRDMLKTQEGQLLLEWGILHVQDEVGREKFLKLHPPSSSE